MREKNTQKHDGFRQRVADERGIFAMRRPVSDDSYEMLGEVIDKLSGLTRSHARVYMPQGLSVTVIGFARYTSAYLKNGLPTKNILPSSPYYNSQIRSQLGELALFGSPTRYKLGFFVVSEALKDEVDFYENFFNARQFPLRNAPNVSGPHFAHLTVGEVVGGNMDRFGHHGLKLINNELTQIFDRLGDRRIWLDPAPVH